MRPLPYSAKTLFSFYLPHFVRVSQSSIIITILRETLNLFVEVGNVTSSDE